MEELSSISQEKIKSYLSGDRLIGTFLMIVFLLLLFSLTGGAVFVRLFTDSFFLPVALGTPEEKLEALRFFGFLSFAAIWSLVKLRKHVLKVVESRNSNVPFGAVEGEVVFYSEKDDNNSFGKLEVAVEKAYRYNPEKNQFEEDLETFREYEFIAKAFSARYDDSDFLGLYRRVICIYGKKSNTLYDILYKDTKESKKFYRGGRSLLEDPARPLWLPKSFESVKKRYEDTTNKVYYGVITYANAIGDLSNQSAKWSIYIGIKERSAMKTEKKYDRAKAKQFGQERYNIEPNQSYYEMERIQAYHNYETLDERFCMDEKVILVTDKHHRKIIEIIKITD